MQVIADEGSPELVKLALESLGEQVRPADGPILRALYEDFDRDGAKRDPGGDVRVEVLRALWHLHSQDDLPLALHARNTSERTLQANGEMIRAAGLALLGVLDPARGAVEAVLVLGRDDADLPPAAPPQRPAPQAASLEPDKQREHQMCGEHRTRRGAHEQERNIERDDHHDIAKEDEEKPAPENPEGPEQECPEMEAVAHEGEPFGPATPLTPSLRRLVHGVDAHLRASASRRALSCPACAGIHVPSHAPFGRRGCRGARS